VHHRRADEDGDEQEGPPDETEGETERGQGSESPDTPQIVGGYLIVNVLEKHERRRFVIFNIRNLLQDHQDSDILGLSVKVVSVHLLPDTVLWVYHLHHALAPLAPGYRSSATVKPLSSARPMS
jgi:hypothetical protein